MRRVVIWVLVILLVAGFIYTGNNLLEANGFAESKTFPVKYIPRTNMLLVAKNGSENIVNAFFPALSSSLPVKGNSRSIYIANGEESALRISDIENTGIAPVDSLIYNFRNESFDTKLEWENGFPLITATTLNKKFYASTWRKWSFVSLDKDEMRKIFSAILQKAPSVSDDPDFQMLWKDSDSPVYGIVYKNSEKVFTENMQIPFVKFEYPAFFEIKPEKITLENIHTAPEGTLYFAPFDFENAIFEVAKPELAQIKDLINESGLQMIISEKLDFPFDKFSAFSSLNSGEFALIGKNEFLFAVKSTPISNSIYENELQNILPMAKTSKEKANGFILITYRNANTSFYTLEMPSLFVISNDKKTLEKIAYKKAKTINAGDCFEFLSVKSQFNDVINLYDLNANPLILPEGTHSCILTRKKDGDKLITEISFSQ